MFSEGEVAVVILNWNGTAFLEKFLPSVLSHSDGADIVIIDNGSNDNPEAALKNTFPAIKWIHLDQNYGFCGGYNLGLSQLNHTYFVLLNSDVEVTSGWLPPLINAMKAQPEIAACQPKLLDYYQPDKFEYAGAAGGFLDRLGYPYCRGRIFDSIEVDSGQYNTSIPIFWATGACLCIRAEAFIQAKGLDENFFAHMEEIDLCWRLQNLGWKIYAIPESVVYHVGGGTLASNHPKKTYLNFRNNLMMLYKNLPNNVLYSTLLSRLILDGVAGLKFLLDRQVRRFFAVIKAHFAFYAFALRYKRLPIQSIPTTVKKESVLFAYYVKRQKTYAELKSVQ